MENSYIPVSEPDLSGSEKEYVLQCLDSGWISSEGSFVTKFERVFAEKCGRRYGVAVSSGTAALVLAFRSLGLSPGDEVIMPAFTIISCAAAIIEAELKPVLVDAEPATWNIDPSAIEAKITERTRAILVVHIYGMPSEMSAILEIADRHGLLIVEDAAEMHGQTYRGRPCGSFGAVSIFSFYANKIVTTGEGGMVMTDDEGIADRCRSLRNLCFEPERRFLHRELGYNFRLTNLQAAIGVAQVERLDLLVAKKRRIGEIYNRFLEGIPGLQLPTPSNEVADNIYWVYGVTLVDEVACDAEEVMHRLQAVGIGTRPFFLGMHEQPVLQEMGLFYEERYPVTERISRRGFYLPSGLPITEEQQRRVAEALKLVLKGCRV